MTREERRYQASLDQLGETLARLPEQIRSRVSNDIDAVVCNIPGDGLEHNLAKIAFLSLVNEIGRQKLREMVSGAPAADDAPQVCTENPEAEARSK